MNMKVKIKNVFNKKDTYENDKKIIIESDECNEIEENINSVKRKYKRKGAYVEDRKLKSFNFKEYFDNFFKNKNKLSRGYYILLFAMLVLGGASVGITFKAYNLFAKEDYELYAKSDTTETKEDAISTISQVETVENTDVNLNKNVQKTETTNNNTGKVESKVINNTNSKSQEKEKNTVKPLAFSKPLDGNINKPYSIDKVIYSKTLELWKTHDGIDISAEIGTSVKAIEKGIVEKIYEDAFYGVTVVIDHSQGYKSSYSNLDNKVSVKEKQTVNKGQVIGKIGATSIGETKDEPHLHFTLFKNDNNVDPTYIFK